MDKARIAVAGAGTIGRAHIQAVLEGATSALCAIADPQPAAQALARELGVPCYPSVDELLARAQPEGVILATPNTQHLPQALACLRAGVAVLVEKPVTATVDEGEALLRAVRDTGGRVLVGHHRAHSPLLAQARQVIAEGVLGRLVAVMGSAVFCKPDRYFEEAPWRREPGAGPILINLIHEVHSLRMLCGEIVAVQALASHAARGFAVEDTVAINLQFANGALGSFMLSDSAACGRSWEQTARENPAYAWCADEDCYVIAGTQGCLHVPTMRLDRYAAGRERSWMQPFDRGVLEARRDDPIRLQLAHFAAVVRGQAEPLVTVADGLRNLRVVEAIAAAARAGGRIPLEHGS